MKKSLFLLALLLPFSVNAQLKINELMTNNVSAVMDDAYNYSMWVEIYNPSTTVPINLSSFYFTDDLKVPKKWKPISNVVAVGGFSVLYFERDERAGHASFKLDPDGGSLYLLNTSLAIVDSVTYPKQLRNISYGRKINSGSEWAFFEQFSMGTTNNGKAWFSVRCENPVFNLKGGFYTTTQKLDFATPLVGDSIYYTINGAEPTRLSSYYVPGSQITLGLNAARVVRAKTFSKNKLSSDIVTSTYFINTRNHHLPVVSIVTSPVNLTDNTIGIYVNGTNGTSGDNGAFANFNQAWERPANYELFDTSQVSCLNQELDIAITGAYSRTFALKPFKIKPDKKYGDGRLRYDIFKETKPNMKYKDIMMRNSGNDFYCSMMRDGFHQTLAMHRMDIDLLAYQPSVMYLNGEYYGILNLREETGTSFMYTNFGLDADDVYIIDKKTIASDTAFAHLRDYISNSDITTDVVYAKVCEMMDVDEFINYHIAEIFIANWDWPWNNVKIWKNRNGGKWRWLMYDTDWAFNYRDNQHFYNTLLYVLGEHPTDRKSDWSNLIMRRLILNKTFTKKFVDRFCVQISGTFKTQRVDAIMDSLSGKISTEIIFHKARWSSDRTLVSDLKRMKEFSALRPDALMGFLSSRFANAAPIRTVNLSSSVPGVTYTMNSEPVIDSQIALKYFDGKSLSLETQPVFGYKFKQWEVSSSAAQQLIKMGDTWKYNDKGSIPAADWYAGTYSDATWSTGPAQLGYGDNEKTLLNFGTDAKNKYPTAYFRKSVSIVNLSNIKTTTLKLFVDDGAVVYVNGTEIGRYMMNAGIPTFDTYANAVNEGDYVSYDVPKALLKQGENLIAVEVHQSNASSSDCIFDLQMDCTLSETTSDIVTDPIFTRTLSSDMNLKAVFEESTVIIPDDDATIVINEVVSDNTDVMDEFGVKEDYIELYNTGEKDVNIAGWYISDITENRTLFQIPTTDIAKTLIPAGGRIVLWADNEPLQGILHVGLKLSKDGETLILSRKNAFEKIVTVDSLECPALAEDMSYSRIPDGGPNWSQELPTFNARNSEFVDVEELVHSSIDLYPTLVTDYFTVRNASGLVLTVTDLTGKVVYRGECESDTEVIPTSSLHQGLYLVTVGNQRFKIMRR